MTRQASKFLSIVPARPWVVFHVRVPWVVCELPYFHLDRDITHCHFDRDINRFVRAGWLRWRLNQDGTCFVAVPTGSDSEQHDDKHNDERRDGDEEIHKGTTGDARAIRIRTPAEGSPTEQGGRTPPRDDREASKNSKHEHN